MKQYWIYIMCSDKNGTLYIGVTNDLSKRVYEHRSKLVKGFTKKYNISRLVYVESFTYIDEAILREKQLKPWKRQWKIDLIESVNPEWKDLYEEFI